MNTRALARQTFAGAAAALLSLAPAVAAGAASTPTAVPSAASPAPATPSGATSVKLPTEKDALAVAVNIERILNGSAGIQTRLPGPVADDERVDAGFGLNGSLVSISDAQRLSLSGLGDFEFKIAGPATDVEALPGSESEPGLRRGSVIWQGFSGGSKSLGALLDLIPGQEVVRLPVRVSLAMSVDGKPVEPGHASTGQLHLRLTVTNNSPLPLQVVDGDIGLEEGAAALDAIRAELAAGRRPEPGAAGVPESIALTDPAFRPTNLEAPFQVEGTISVQASRWTLDHATGAAASPNASGALTFSALLGGGSPLSHTVDLTATVRDLEVPAIAIRGTPAPPSADSLAPPAGSTWSEGVRTDPSKFDPRTMTGLIVDTMWRTARLRQFDAYLGNPDPTGPASTVYRFALSAVSAPVNTPVADAGTGVMGAIAGAALAIVVVGGAIVLWSRS